MTNPLRIYESARLNVTFLLAFIDLAKILISLNSHRTECRLSVHREFYGGFNSRI